MDDIVNQFKNNPNNMFFNSGYNNKIHVTYIGNDKFKISDEDKNTEKTITGTVILIKYLTKLVKDFDESVWINYNALRDIYNTYKNHIDIRNEIANRNENFIREFFTTMGYDYEEYVNFTYIFDESDTLLYSNDTDEINILCKGVYALKHSLLYTAIVFSYSQDIVELLSDNGAKLTENEKYFGNFLLCSSAPLFPIITIDTILDHGLPPLCVLQELLSEYNSARDKNDKILYVFWKIEQNKGKGDIISDEYEYYMKQVATKIYESDNQSYIKLYIQSGLSIPHLIASILDVNLIRHNADNIHLKIKDKKLIESLFLKIKETKYDIPDMYVEFLASIFIKSGIYTNREILDQYLNSGLSVNTLVITMMETTQVRIGILDYLFEKGAILTLKTLGAVFKQLDEVIESTNYIFIDRNSDIVYHMLKFMKNILQLNTRESDDTDIILLMDQALSYILENFGGSKLDYDGIFREDDKGNVITLENYIGYITVAKSKFPVVSQFLTTDNIAITKRVRELRATFNETIERLNKDVEDANNRGDDARVEHLNLEIRFATSRHNNVIQNEIDKKSMQEEIIHLSKPLVSMIDNCINILRSYIIPYKFTKGVINNIKKLVDSPKFVNEMVNFFNFSKKFDYNPAPNHVVVYNINDLRQLFPSYIADHQYYVTAKKSKHSDVNKYTPPSYVNIEYDEPDDLPDISSLFGFGQEEEVRHHIIRDDITNIQKRLVELYTTPEKLNNKQFDMKYFCKSVKEFFVWDEDEDEDEDDLYHNFCTLKKNFNSNESAILNYVKFLYYVFEFLLQGEVHMGKFKQGEVVQLGKFEQIVMKLKRKKKIDISDINIKDLIQSCEDKALERYDRLNIKKTEQVVRNNKIYTETITYYKFRQKLIDKYYNIYLDKNNIDKDKLHQQHPDVRHEHREKAKTELKMKLIDCIIKQKMNLIECI